MVLNGGLPKSTDCALLIVIANVMVLTWLTPGEGQSPQMPSASSIALAQALVTISSRASWLKKTQGQHCTFWSHFRSPPWASELQIINLHKYTLIDKLYLEKQPPVQCPILMLRIPVVHTQMWNGLTRTKATARINVLRMMQTIRWTSLLYLNDPADLSIPATTGLLHKHSAFF
jgi:hypothetical protein